MITRILQMLAALGNRVRRLENDSGSAAVFAATTENQTISVDTPTAITELVATLGTGYYQCEVWLLCDAAAASEGNISNGGDAVFEANLLGEMYNEAGEFSVAGKPTDFETADGLVNTFSPGRLLTFTGTIKVTTAGTIELEGASRNNGNDFIISENSTMSFTKIGDI